jgi:hypothetical protein
MNVSTDRPFGEVVREYAARSHDLDWVSLGDDSAVCVYCGAVADDARPFGLPWVEFTPSMINGCEGPTQYADDGERIGDCGIAWVASEEVSGLQGAMVLNGDAIQEGLFL